MFFVKLFVKLLYVKLFIVLQFDLLLFYIEQFDLMLFIIVQFIIEQFQFVLQLQFVLRGLFQFGVIQFN